MGSAEVRIHAPGERTSDNLFYLELFAVCIGRTEKQRPEWLEDFRQGYAWDIQIMMHCFSPIRQLERTWKETDLRIEFSGLERSGIDTGLCTVHNTRSRRGAS